MKHKKQNNLTLIVVSAAILVAANLGVWMAAKHGVIAPIENHALWTAFVVLNVISLVWGISLLGLHPLVVTISYVAGGFIAFKGVEGMSGISIAEITTAGATYGAFGALAVGNCTARVRLAFFNKGQVPFIFIIAALLVFDAVLNSEISRADESVILNAVVFPFVLAGVMIGLVWSILNRYGIGDQVDLAPGAIAVEHADEHTDAVEEVDAPEESDTLKMLMPGYVEEEEGSDAVAAAMEDVELPETTELPTAEAAAPIVAQEEKEEEFFPLEIDKHDDFILSQEETSGDAERVAELDSQDEDPLLMGEFDVNLYDSGADEDEHQVDVMEEDPLVSLLLDIDEPEPFADQPEMASLAEVEQSEPEQEKSVTSDDWLSGHLALLNKLK